MEIKITACLNCGTLLIDGVCQLCEIEAQEESPCDIFGNYDGDCSCCHACENDYTKREITNCPECGALLVDSECPNCNGGEDSSGGCDGSGGCNRGCGCSCNSDKD